MDNPLFLQQEKFEPGDSSLHFYLFNWRTARLANGLAENMQPNAGNMGGVGVTML